MKLSNQNKIEYKNLGTKLIEMNENCFHYLSLGYQYQTIYKPKTKSINNNPYIIINELFFYNILNRTIKTMSIEKNFSPKAEVNDSQPECKKIQDYIYKFSDVIGIGNFSKVFKGYHQLTSTMYINLDKEVAIKIIQLNSLNNSRLQQLLNTETKILKTLSHPNVIGCYQILSSVRNCYIIMQLCNGGDLQKKLKKNGQIPEHQLFSIAFDIYQGLKYLAKRHIIHRDIKTSNIFISNGVHKIADFGFAQIAEKQFRDMSVGSPIFMSPQGYIHNLYGPKTDVWAFGVMLYQLVQGKTPCHNCQNENQLKINLMKQIDYSNFTVQVSNQLKNLIIQCLNINSSTRINMLDIENTQWMKKVYQMVGQQKQIQNSELKDKFNTNKKDYHKFFSQQTKIKQLNQQLQLSINKDPTKIDYKKLLKKYTADNQQKNNSEQGRKKHYTLDKPEYKSITDQDSSQSKFNNQTSKIFYSPKNMFNTATRPFNPKHLNPNPKYDSFNLKTSIKAPETFSFRAKDKNTNTTIYSLFHRNNKQENSKLGQNSNEMQKFSSSKQVKDTDPNQLLQPSTYSNIESCINYSSSPLNYKQTKQSTKQYKKPLKAALSVDFKNLIKPPFSVISPLSQNYLIGSPKVNDGKMKISQFFQAKVFKPININKSQEKFDLHKDLKNQSLTNSHKIFNRTIKFGDCIGLIHYCRLCYKFACLLNQYGEAEQTKKYLTSWSVQLLNELNDKIDKGQIQFSNQISNINSPLISNHHSVNEKKKKLSDVAKQYLNKYGENLKLIDRQILTLKQASNFISNLYITKGRQFHEKARDKKSYLYYALICYLSILERQTKNLMEFIYEIKNSMESKNIEKLLTIKIHQFQQKNIQDIFHSNTENLCSFL